MSTGYLCEGRKFHDYLHVYTFAAIQANRMGRSVDIFDLEELGGGEYPSTTVYPDEYKRSYVTQALPQAII